MLLYYKYTTFLCCGRALQENIQFSINANEIRINKYVLMEYWVTNNIHRILFSFGLFIKELFFS